jgi:hypothetical protein
MNAGSGEVALAIVRRELKNGILLSFLVALAL